MGEGGHLWSFMAISQSPKPIFLAVWGRHAPLSQSAFPRIIWMFWAQGDGKGLGFFRRACIQSWVCNNPAWRVVLLSVSSCFSFIATSDLPEKWQYLRWDVLSDAVRLALLARHGGVYVDISVVCTKPLDDWLNLSSSATDIDLEAFYYPKFGRSDHTNRGEFVENWFLASPKCSELMQRWHAAFLQFWKGRTDATQDGGLLASGMFKDIDLQAMREDQTNYLTMHCCFKWLIDSDPFARQRWQTATALHSGDAAIGWIRELGGVEQNWNETNVACFHVARWLYKNDTAWVSELIQRAPMLKFVGAHASIFDKQPEQNLMQQGTCMCFLMNHSVAWSTGPEVLEFDTFEVVNWPCKNPWQLGAAARSASQDTFLAVDSLSWAPGLNGWTSRFQNLKWFKRLPAPLHSATVARLARDFVMPPARSSLAAPAALPTKLMSDQWDKRSQGQWQERADVVTLTFSKFLGLVRIQSQLVCLIAEKRQ